MTWASRATSTAPTTRMSSASTAEWVRRSSLLPDRRSMDFLVGLQRWINASITADLSAFAATRDWLALLAVLPFGIAFGAVHALTPGHGKTVLASYLVGSRLAVIRSLAVAGALAITHSVRRSSLRLRQLRS